MKVSDLIAEARQQCAHPNVHFHYTDGPRVMSGLADALEAALSALPPDGEAVAWQWSDFSGNWYTPDTARMTSAEQEELARSVAESHHGRVRPLYAHPAPGNADRSEGVRVRELEWGKTSYGTPEATTVVGTYRLNNAWNGGWTVTRNSFVLAGTNGLTNFATEIEAKAAAQADFDQRVRSCLSPPQPEEGDKRAVDLSEEQSILQRLADGDTIVFSQDGDDAWFSKGDRAQVGRVIIQLREKGWVERRCDDDENYRGMSEYDAITEAGRTAILALRNKP